MAKVRDKYLVVADRLSRRIRNGDYHVHGVPPERVLATQVGVSHATLRKSIQILLDAGLLVRQPNGRLAVAEAAEGGVSQKQVALLSPAWESSEANFWNIGLAQLRDRFAFGSRMVHYTHGDDPVVFNTIRQFDTTFFLPPREPTEKYTRELTKFDKPLIVLNDDWTPWGIRSLRMLPPVFIQRLLDHLAALGHRRLACFNVQPKGAVIDLWIRQWDLWCAANDMDGVLIDEPVPSGTDTLAAAYQIMDRRIRAGQLTSTGVLCLTETAALGMVRAMLDHGIRPGHDIAICTVGSQRCEYLPITFTTLAEPDPKPYLAACLEWALGGDRAVWRGPLLVEPLDTQVVVRQSTVPDIDQSRTPQRMKFKYPPNNERRTQSSSPQPSRVPIGE